MSGNKKKEYYTNADNKDWVDQFAETRSIIEFRGAMIFTIGKYFVRLGKKDDIIQELGKVKDYVCRWIEYEQYWKEKEL